MYDFSALQGVSTIENLGVIRVDGEDGAKFIHGQLSNDFLLLDTTQARLAAFCTPKGRMQASFIGVKTGQTQLLLVCSKDLLAATLKRLAMFVMRSKVKLTDASADYMLFGLAGDAVIQRMDGDHKPWSTHASHGVHQVDLYPAGGVPRQLWLVPANSPEPKGPPLDPSLWAWGEVCSAVATVSQATFEAFVPQMLNYESVGGVNFKKGCYPGQEVVARSQFRGTLKRRAFVAHTASATEAGIEIYPAEEDSQPVGTVVQSAPSPHGGWDAIISVQLSALSSGTLHYASPKGPEMALQPLPYTLLEDV
ncbi:YgfZ/GcvT domain-containing protein [Rhodoferax aquaticus]|uniref:Folate-binding protein n=1 Tax=Rhodoferax aquaticus TaxID=2527691 RepID=A0A515EPN9_9BURK|nr:folate-binding protein YgfZ [Rhodoferax aquaticus]QDL54633.1 folate-binding protein [Rhodoferax aquaticus]